MNKYFKPKSLTWITSTASLLTGAFMACEPMHGMSDLVASIYNASGMTAQNFIHAGLMGIGLRGAMG